MATIGLDKLYYAKITEDADGNETYATPVQMAKAMTADLSVELAEATLYADDGASEIVKEFKSGTLSLGVDDLGGSVASDLTGAVIDNNVSEIIFRADKITNRHVKNAGTFDKSIYIWLRSAFFPIVNDICRKSYFRR